MMPDKDKYMTVGRDSTLRLWNAGTLQHTRTVQMPDQSWCTEALYCEAQGKLVLATVNSRLLLYDATNLRPHRCPQPFRDLKEQCLRFEACQVKYVWNLQIVRQTSLKFKLQNLKINPKLSLISSKIVLI